MRTTTTTARHADPLAGSPVYGPMISGTMAQAKFEAMFDHTPQTGIEMALIASQS
jgi:hypothetical protein